jgi:hypothetical protein
MPDEVNELLKALKQGKMTIDEVSQKFRERTWPRRLRSPRPETYIEMEKAEQRDPEPYLPGSFDDVTAAYHRGDISDEQYDRLADAMAESKRSNT